MGEWTSVDLYGDDDIDLEEEVAVWVSPADIAGVEIGSFGYRKLVVTSGDEKERLLVRLHRTDFAILSDLSARCSGKTIEWGVPASAVVAAFPAISEAEALARL